MRRRCGLFFHGEADGEDAVAINPLADFFKTGGFDKLIRFLLAAVAHHPVGAAVFVAGEGAVERVKLIEADNVLQAAFGDKAAACFDIEQAVVAQAHRVGQGVSGEGVEHIERPWPEAMSSTCTGLPAPRKRAEAV